MTWASYTHGRLIPQCIPVTSLLAGHGWGYIMTNPATPPQLSVQIWTPPWRVARSKRPREAIGYPPPFRARHMELFPSLRIVTSLKCLTFFRSLFQNMILVRNILDFIIYSPLHGVFYSIHFINIIYSRILIKLFVYALLHLACHYFILFYFFDSTAHTFIFSRTIAWKVLNWGEKIKLIFFFVWFSKVINGTLFRRSLRLDIV